MALKLELEALETQVHLVSRKSSLALVAKLVGTVALSLLRPESSPERSTHNWPWRLWPCCYNSLHLSVQFTAVCEGLDSDRKASNANQT
jgi:hypothetical protein